MSKREAALAPMWNKTAMDLLENLLVAIHQDSRRHYTDTLSLTESVEEAMGILSRLQQSYSAPKADTFSAPASCIDVTDEPAESDWRDRIRLDHGFEATASKAHWKGFTREQKRKIRANAPPWVLGEAIANAEIYPFWPKLKFSVSRAWQTFFETWSDLS